MIPLKLRVETDGDQPFVTRLRFDRGAAEEHDSILLSKDPEAAVFAGNNGVLVFDELPPDGVDGDVILVDPPAGRVERLFRANSEHNTLLVTERCDQLCVMCSQPPKKTHVDRFRYFERACALAPEGTLIGITGGEPTLYKDQLFSLIQKTCEQRADLAFHVLTNGQHFEAADIEVLRSPAFERVIWGIPLYAPDAALHDEIVGKAGAFERLHHSFHHLLLSGARIELRTVLLQSNARVLPQLATRIAHRLRFIETWSIMQLEHVGFVKNRWDSLYFDHRANFQPVREALNTTAVRDIDARLFNFPLCTVPGPYRAIAARSISDWKRKFMAGCAGCSQQRSCTGFFEWHPIDHPSAEVTAL